MFSTPCSEIEAESGPRVRRWVPRQGRCVRFAALLLSLTALPAAAQTAISADGVVESQSGGFMFPDGTVQTTAAGITDPLHFVGEAGEPAFGNGGAGDCLWQNPPADTGALFAANPVSFVKDSDGIVRLTGLPVAVDGPGGDAICDSTSNMSDTVIFQLPAGYQPEHLEIFVSGNPDIGLNLIVPQGGLLFGEEFVPGGAVLAVSITGGNVTTLDGTTFRAAPPMAAPPPAPPSVSLQALRDLLGQR
jgi:hypothetical protein